MLEHVYFGVFLLNSRIVGVISIGGHPNGIAPS
jgi:hypothetical protein